MSSSPAEPIAWRPVRAGRGSLFLRLLAVQVTLVASLGLALFALFYVERNVTIAKLYADRWAAPLAVAAGRGVESASVDAAVERRDAPPAGSRQVSGLAPRFAALREALQARGLPVQQLRLELDQPSTRVWLQLPDGDGRPLWLGVAGDVVAPEWSVRTPLAVALVSALVLMASWLAARHLARPLERLRQRIAQQALGAAEATAMTPGTAPPEIAAIEWAYVELLDRWQRQQRERALLLAGVSHDLRSPLGRIRMAAELLPHNDDTARRKEVIARNVAEADRLIESFLDFVRAGELPCDDTVDLASTARAVVAAFDAPPDVLTVEAPASLPLHHAHTLLVERLMTNLLDNALKHGQAPVCLRLQGGGNAPVSLAVEDAGQGLTAARFEALQEAFRRGDSARSRAGSGLGLTIVREVAARLGADLHFEPLAHGQRVSVTWPDDRGRASRERA